MIGAARVAAVHLVAVDLWGGSHRFEVPHENLWVLRLSKTASRPWASPESSLFLMSVISSLMLTSTKPPKISSAMTLKSVDFPMPRPCPASFSGPVATNAGRFPGGPPEARKDERLDQLAIDHRVEW